MGIKYNQKQNGVYVIPHLVHKVLHSKKKVKVYIVTYLVHKEQSEVKCQCIHRIIVLHKVQPEVKGRS